MINMMKIQKKNGRLENFNLDKIKAAVTKSSERVMVELTEKQWGVLFDLVEQLVFDFTVNDPSDEPIVPITEMHKIVEIALSRIDPLVAESYRSYRNYKTDFVAMLDEVYKKAQSVMYIGDKENSNSDSSLVSTKRSLIAGELSKALYQKFFLTPDELKACEDGFIYIHDMRDRLYTFNCCLCDVATVMKGGFEMGNIWYNEPKTLDTACDVMGDIILGTASQQYGGFTVPHVDTTLAYYVEKSYNKHLDFLVNIANNIDPEYIHQNFNALQIKAWKMTERELEQGIQGLEIKLNTVASSRGDYPFVTFSFGNDTNPYARLVSEVILRTRKNGQGKDGYKKPVLFPKLVFIYDENLHGQGKELENLFDRAVECSAKCMYPDFLSVTGKGTLAEMYEKYHEVISCMGKSIAHVKPCEPRNLGCVING